MGASSCWAVAQHRPIDGCFCKAPENIAGTRLSFDAGSAASKPPPSPAQLDSTRNAPRAAPRPGGGGHLVSSRARSGVPRVNKNSRRRFSRGCLAPVGVAAGTQKNMPQRPIVRQAGRHVPERTRLPRPRSRPRWHRATCFGGLRAKRSPARHVDRRWRQRAGQTDWHSKTERAKQKPTTLGESSRARNPAGSVAAARQGSTAALGDPVQGQARHRPITRPPRSLSAWDGPGKAGTAQRVPVPLRPSGSNGAPSWIL